MNPHPMAPVRSEKGVALVVVLLLLAVMGGLTTGLTLNGQTEIGMATNERYYAGTRAAAEAGMNRAVEQIIGDTATNLLVTGPAIGTGPFALTDDYSYTLEILDDDDPALYPIALTAAQLTQMNENGDPEVDGNTRLILRSTGVGPRGTTVTVSRMLQSTEIPDLPGTNTILSNPAILVNGDIGIAGAIQVLGLRGNVHANGDVTGTGNSYKIAGDLTATGELLGNVHADGLIAGGMPPIVLPEIKASDFLNLADYILTSTGTIVLPNGDPCGASCPSGWSFSGGTWKSSGSMPSTATYYVQGDAEMHGTGNQGGFTELSVITEGSLKVTGNGKFKPENGAGIQFVTNGDFELGGTADADDSVDMDGQIMVREQIKIYGNSRFQGRVMVGDRDGANNIYDAVTNPDGRRGIDTVDANSLSGRMTVTYNGGLGDLVTPIVIPPGPSTYTNNITGWIER